jgi:cytochrome P450
MEIDDYLEHGTGDPLYREYSDHREREAIRVAADAVGGPRYCLYRYADVAAAFRDARFGAATAPPNLLRALRWMGLGSLADVVESGLLIALDPPDHTRVRQVVESYFRSREMEWLKSRVEEIVEEICGRVQKSGHFDLIAEFAGPLPTRIIAELVGFPPEEQARLRQWADDLTPLMDSDLQRSALVRRVTAFQGFRRHVIELIEKRRHEPRGDLLSALARAHYATRELSQAEAVGAAIFVLTAGHATTTHLIGTAILSLLKHPGELDRLRADPRLIDGTMEEAFRFESPIQRTGRVLLEDIELYGRRIPQGSKMRLVIGAANRDPRRFENPDQFDIERSDNRHLGFGGGIHQCVGMHLARLEARIAIGTLVRRFPRLERASEELRWVRGTKFRGLAELVVKI